MCRIIEDMRREEREEGVQIGLEKGRQEGREEAAQRMLEAGKYALEEIAAITGLPPEEVARLRDGGQEG